MKQYLKKLWRWYSLHFPVSATKVLYRKTIGSIPNLKEPHKLTEKIQYLKLFCYSKDYRVPLCIDKYSVRNYIMSLGCDELLNELVGHWDQVEQIDWEQLPEKFAMKCTHGCGYNIICKNKAALDIPQVKKTLEQWMSTTYGIEGVETIYYNVKPSIICEKYIDAVNSEYPTDYKFFCSYGEVKFLYVATEKKDGLTYIDYFTPEWEWIPVKNGRHENRKNVSKPARFDDLKKYCKILGASFPIARIDFYCEENRIIFGEITFSPSGGLCRFDPPEYDEIFGELFPIEVKKG